MQRKIVIFLLLILFVSNLTSAQSIEINSGYSIKVPFGYEISAEEIIVNVGGSLFADDSSCFGPGLIFSGDGLIQIGTSEWLQQISGTDLGLYGVDFPLSDYGWAVGSQGSILTTSNKGDSWELQNSGTSNQLRSVSFISGLQGWASGINGTIVKTTNAGQLWTAQHSGTNEHELNEIFFIDENFGWACGDFKILRSTNSGLNWLHFNSNFNHEFKSLFFVNNNSGWVVGGKSGTPNSVILHTTDGGLNWQEQPTTGDHWLYGVFFLDDNLGWAVGTAGLILKTTNGGSDWEYRASVTSKALKDIIFIDPFEGWIVGQDGVILHTTDGGEQWLEQASPVITFLNALSFSPEGSGFVVGDVGKILVNSYIPLPVELTDFSGATKEHSIYLTWKTATEYNNHGFDIYRSKTGKGNWVQLEFIKGNGNSNSPKSYSYIDSNPHGRSRFYYKLKQVDNSGEYSFSDIIEIELLPVKNELYQNYPNPFNPETKIKFSLLEQNNAVLTIYNILGEQIIEKSFQDLEAGFHEFVFDGSALASGAYIYRISSGNYSEIKKMLLLK